MRCGFDHSLALTSNSILYSWGANRSGQCGDGSTVTVATPKLVGDFAHRGVAIEHIDCGAYHSFCRTQRGEVFFWGSNKQWECIEDEVDDKIVDFILQPQSIEAALARRLNDENADRNFVIESVKLGIQSTALTLSYDDADDVE